MTTCKGTNRPINVLEKMCNEYVLITNQTNITSLYNNHIFFTLFVPSGEINPWQQPVDIFHPLPNVVFFFNAYTHFLTLGVELFKEKKNV